MEGMENNTTTEETPLWLVLQEQGFKYKEKLEEIPFWVQVLDFITLNKRVPNTLVSYEWLTKTINGQVVDIYGIDYWYTQMSIDGEVVFDARRFKNEELLSLIPKDNG